MGMQIAIRPRCVHLRRHGFDIRRIRALLHKELRHHREPDCHRSAQHLMGRFLNRPAEILPDPLADEIIRHGNF